MIFIWMQVGPIVYVIFLNGPIPVSFGLFSSFSTWHKSIQIDKSIDGLLGTWIHGGRMEGADESTELWRQLCTLLDQQKENINYF